MLLIINIGSSSFRWAVFDNRLVVIKNGKITGGDDTAKIFQSVWQDLEKEKLTEKIQAVGHRVVFGPDDLSNPCLADENIIKKIDKVSPAAPLHNPRQLKTIFYCYKNLKIPQIIHFDNGFFRHLPLAAQVLPIPYRYWQQGWRKVGYHGLSHAAAAELKKYPKIISVHAGSGVSVAAISNGRPIDTTMGMTPLAGAVMMTRPGDLDPGVVLKLIEENGLNKTREILNHQSGVKGIAETSDMIEILRASDKRSLLAKKIFTNSLQKIIGSYIILLGGADALVFSGAIVQENNSIRRQLIAAAKKLVPAIKIKVVGGGEEIIMAKETLKFLRRKKNG